MSTSTFVVVEAKYGSRRQYARLIERFHVRRLDQVRDWKTNHKVMCAQLREMRAESGCRRNPIDRQSVMARVLAKIRLYLCPFAVCHGQTQGRGFVFVQVREGGGVLSRSADRSKATQTPFR